MSENTLSIRRTQHHTTNWWKEEKVKIAGQKKKQQIRQTEIEVLYGAITCNTCPNNVTTEKLELELLQKLD